MINLIILAIKLIDVCDLNLRVNIKDQSEI